MNRRNIKQRTTMNPFEYGKIVEGKHFCGRTDLIRQVAGHMASSQNMYISGLRRVGKSSLVNEVVRKTPGYTLLKVDFMGVRSVDTVCRRMLTEIAAFEKSRGWLENILKTFSYLRPVIGVNPITNTPTLSFSMAVEMREESIQATMSLIEGLGKKNKLVVFFDEFQDILKMRKDEAYEVLALMRSKIQYHKGTTYIFAGSVRQKMEEIFTHSESPFFKSAIPISVDPLSYEEFAPFIKKKFKEGKREISDETAKRIFDIADGITGDVQEVCNALWEVTPESKNVDGTKLGEAVDLIFSRELKAYADYVNLLTDKQMKCLQAIARLGGKSVLSAKFVSESGLKLPSTVKRGVDRLLNLNIIFEYQGEYRFVNPFFRAWLLQNS